MFSETINDFYFLPWIGRFIDAETDWQIAPFQCLTMHAFISLFCLLIWTRTDVLQHARENSKLFRVLQSFKLIFALEMFIPSVVRLFTRRIWLPWHCLCSAVPKNRQLWWMKPRGAAKKSSKKRIIAICACLSLSLRVYTCDLAQICIYFYHIDSRW